MKVSAEQLYEKLVTDYKLIGQKGQITFKLKDITVEIETKDTVGNLIQEWLKEWMRSEKIDFEENPNTQTFPDIFLDMKDRKKGLLEIKTFDFDRGPGFDLANFDSYSNSLLTNSYRVDSDYLILAYQMIGSEITIKDVWLKKIWELAGASSTYPLKVQEKKKVIYNIRPIIWFSKRSKFGAFKSKEEFLKALNETRYQYPKTHHDNAHWLNKVIKNYKEHTGSSLVIN
ncbi:Type-2 restriction enzyme NlaIV [Crenothrix polyspora]|uniref:Type-2 restriction enzyme NlaIV n=1 Tax=Crenothrix polyspora TaxID=360316 RepID=A0A1R4HCR0_9GAMM|nr:NgoBV family restriction endonuclease [Crenothrix polyspora]SJM94024.1 Type-2 restriction enzyme NlaIV [Crenothrix polyspora]